MDIDLPKLLTRVRAGQSPTSNGQVHASDGAGLGWMTKFALRIYTRLATQPKLFALSQKLASLGTRLLSPRSEWVRLPAFTGWGYSKDLPRFAGKTFRERWMEKGKSVVRYTSKQVDTYTSSQTAIPVLPVSMSTSSLVSLFTSELSTLSGIVHQTKNPTQSIIEYLLSNNVKKIYLQPNVLNENFLRQSSIDFTHDPDPTLTVGVTKAWAGLADTGSILEADDELHGSLLPEVHIAVLRSKDIYASMPAAIGLAKDKNAVFITGPSRTADIEMTLTIGVHGPREIHVFVDDSISG